MNIGPWAVANGLDAGQIIDIGTLPNHAMGRVLQEMDVALFPNRCEGGTNLVAMECMACSLPTIVSANTGHLDLVANRCALCPETRQNPLPVATETAIGTATAGVKAMWKKSLKHWNRSGPTGNGPGCVA